MFVSEFYPRDKLPEKLRTHEGYKKVIKSIEDYDDFRYHFNTIVGECIKTFRTYQLCSALDELTQRTCLKFQGQEKYFLMNVINAHIANFYRDRLCQLATINDFDRKEEDFPYLDKWYTDSEEEESEESDYIDSDCDENSGFLDANNSIVETF